MDQNDLRQIRELLKDEFDNNNKAIMALVDVKLDVKIGKLEDKLFGWRSEIINIVDGLVKEIRDEREFRDIASHQIGDNIRIIEKIEKNVFGAAEV